jgi:hypothetical protein
VAEQMPDVIIEEVALTGLRHHDAIYFVFFIVGYDDIVRPV